MTILYKPVLIETAEQAEALPIGSVAYRDVIGGPARYSAVKTPAGDWYVGGREYHENDEMVDWTALVPIEAEEETIPNAWFPDARAPHLSRRLVTPWEGA